MARDLKNSRKAAEKQGVEETGCQCDPPHAGPEPSRAVARGRKQSGDVTGAGASCLVVGHVRKRVSMTSVSDAGSMASWNSSNDGGVSTAGGSNLVEVPW